jgi:hypothetical protein
MLKDKAQPFAVIIGKAGSLYLMVSLVHAPEEK